LRIVQPMPLTPGTRVGRYDVVRQLGPDSVSAHDFGRGRDVVLRTLQRNFAAGEDRSQFERAVNLSEVQHPSIADIYGIEEIEPGAFALVAEYVDGETLLQRINRGPIARDEGLTIARQVASAIEAAHGREVIHGDLTPASIVFAAGGGLKVRGFGVATLLNCGLLAPYPHTVDAGAQGARAAYVSPEQRRGFLNNRTPEQKRDAGFDKRTDIWSFGALLFAMFTGIHPFAGANDDAALDAVEHHEPVWNELARRMPPHIAHLVRQCLDRDRPARISDIAVVQYRLNYVVATPVAPGAPPVAAQSSAILDGVAAWVQRRPRVMRLFSGLGRRVALILAVTRRNVLVLGADEVREALIRGGDFELGPFGGPKMLMGPFLLGMDPRQQYDDERALVERILGELLNRLRDVAGEESKKQAATLDGKRSIDVVNDFAEPIVTRVACGFFGIDLPQLKDTSVLAPRSREELLSQWVRKVGSVIATNSPAPFGLQRVAEDCAKEFRDYLNREILERSDVPNDTTVLGKLLRRVNDGELTRERVLPTLAGLMLAGSTPLVKSITHVIDQILRLVDPRQEAPDSQVLKALLSDNQALQQLRSDDQALERLLLEALRFNPTFPVVLRYCPFTKILGGGQARRLIPAGASLYVTLIGALFDAEINDADHFMPGRPADEDTSLIFGWGQHHCLGRYVATAELVEMLRAFLELGNVIEFKRSRIRYDGPAADRYVISRRRS